MKIVGLMFVIWAAMMLGVEIAVRYPPKYSAMWHIAAEIVILAIGILMIIERMK